MFRRLHILRRFVKGASGKTSPSPPSTMNAKPDSSSTKTLPTTTNPVVPVLTTTSFPARYLTSCLSESIGMAEREQVGESPNRSCVSIKTSWFGSCAQYSVMYGNGKSTREICSVDKHNAWNHQRAVEEAYLAAIRMNFVDKYNSLMASMESLRRYNKNVKTAIVKNTFRTHTNLLSAIRKLVHSSGYASETMVSENSIHGYKRHVVKLTVYSADFPKQDFEKTSCCAEIGWLTVYLRALEHLDDKMYFEFVNAMTYKWKRILTLPQNPIAVIRNLAQFISKIAMECEQTGEEVRFICQGEMIASYALPVEEAVLTFIDQELPKELQTSTTTARGMFDTEDLRKQFIRSQGFSYEEAFVEIPEGTIYRMTVTKDDVSVHCFGSVKEDVAMNLFQYVVESHAPEFTPWIPRRSSASASDQVKKVHTSCSITSTTTIQDILNHRNHSTYKIEMEPLCVTTSLEPLCARLMRVLFGCRWCVWCEHGDNAEGVIRLTATSMSNNDDEVHLHSIVGKDEETSRHELCLFFLQKMLPQLIPLIPSQFLILGDVFAGSDRQSILGIYIKAMHECGVSLRLQVKSAPLLRSKCEAVSVESKGDTILHSVSVASKFMSVFTCLSDVWKLPSFSQKISSSHTASIENTLLHLKDIDNIEEYLRQLVQRYIGKNVRVHTHHVQGLFVTTVHLIDGGMFHFLSDAVADSYLLSRETACATASYHFPRGEGKRGDFLGVFTNTLYPMLDYQHVCDMDPQVSISGVPDPISTCFLTEFPKLLTSCINEGVLLRVEDSKVLLQTKEGNILCEENISTKATTLETVMKVCFTAIQNHNIEGLSSLLTRDFSQKGRFLRLCEKYVDRVGLAIGLNIRRSTSFESQYELQFVLRGRNGYFPMNREPIVSKSIKSMTILDELYKQTSPLRIFDVTSIDDQAHFHIPQAQPLDFSSVLLDHHGDNTKGVQSMSTYAMMRQTIAECFGPEVIEQWSVSCYHVILSLLNTKTNHVIHSIKCTSIPYGLIELYSHVIRQSSACRKVFEGFERKNPYSVKTSKTSPPLLPLDVLARVVQHEFGLTLRIKVVDESETHVTNAIVMSKNDETGEYCLVTVRLRKYLGQQKPAAPGYYQKASLLALRVHFPYYHEKHFSETQTT
eukprot:PhF_6_TR44262/c0_g1_i1/m.68172